MEGRRPLLAEVQALVDAVRRRAPAPDDVRARLARVAMVLAVLAAARRRPAARPATSSPRPSAASGSPSRPADLAIARGRGLGATADVPLPRGVVAIGEIGLAGELRRVPRPRRSGSPRRARLGFQLRPGARRAPGAARPRGRRRVVVDGVTRVLDGARRACSALGLIAGHRDAPRRRPVESARHGRHARYDCAPRPCTHRGAGARGRTATWPARSSADDDAAPARDPRRRSPRAPPLRDGLERILRGRTGALIVLGHDKVVESISHRRLRPRRRRSPPPACASWPRWTARSSSTSDVTRILRAAVHLMPDHDHPHRGDRHPAPHRRAGRQADRLPGDLGVAVDADHRAVRRRDPRTCSRTPARSCPAPTRRWPPSSATSSRLDEVSGTLSALEIEDLVTVRDVAVVAQRLEMVTPDRQRDRGLRRRARHRRPAALPAARGAGRRRRRRARAGDPRLPARAGRRAKPPEALLAELEALVRRPSWSTSAAVARALGLGSGEHLDARGRARAATGCWPRCRGCPRAVVDRLVDHFGTPAEAALRRHRRPAGRRRRRRAARPQRPRGPVPPGRVQHPRALRLSRPAVEPLPARACRLAIALAGPCRGRPRWLRLRRFDWSGSGRRRPGDRRRLGVGAARTARRSARRPARPRRRGTSRAAPSRSAASRSSSERRPFQVTPTLVATALRTTTLARRDRLRAVLAGPDVVVARGDLHGERLGRDRPGAGLGAPGCAAGARSARRAPPTGVRRRSGVTAMSLGARSGPRGSASGRGRGAWFFGWLVLARLLGRLVAPAGVDGPPRSPGASGGRPAWPGRRRSRSSLPAPSSRAMPNTSSERGAEHQQPAHPVDARRQRAAGQGGHGATLVTAPALRPVVPHRRTVRSPTMSDLHDAAAAVVRRARPRPAVARAPTRPRGR